MSSTQVGAFPPTSEPRPVESRSTPPSAPSEPEPRYNWRVNAGLFLATIVSVFWVGQGWTATQDAGFLRTLIGAWIFAVPLLAILLAHEFGHYIAARIHKVPASLPYFIPLPVLSPFGTMGAVIVMPRRIRSANALLDIGAAGPLAGMVVAIPMMLWGLSLSSLGPRGGGAFYIQEGQSLLYWLLKTIVFGAIRPDQDVQLHPTALAAWAGFLVTFLNLLPFGQLDGGHVAYALFGERQNRIGPLLKFVPLGVMAWNVWVFGHEVVQRFIHKGKMSAWLVASGISTWFFIFLLLTMLGRLSGTTHPPVDDASLSPVRKVIAVFTLALFLLLFMPTPWVVYLQ